MDELKVNVYELFILLMDNANMSDGSIFRLSSTMNNISQNLGYETYRSFIEAMEEELNEGPGKSQN